ncbi:MAG TPA: sialidase family protein [Candidatus Dormibacteraeota bacterium]|nr:sialidase family protein [Candidatus Dormibacteraeota bacterium]
MKNSLFLIGWSALVILPALALATSASAQEHLQTNPDAVFKTHVRHLNSVVNLEASRKQTIPLAITPDALFSGNPYGVGPTVMPTTTLPEAEEHIAVDPLNPANLVTAVSDFSSVLGFNTTKFAYSNDGGGTWTESFIPLDPFFGFFPATGDGFLWFANSDPVVAIDRAGNVYLADLYLDAIDNGNGFYVSVGTVSGGAGSFSVANTLPVITNPDASTPFLEDKPWIAVDNSNDLATTGTVYAAWSHFFDNGTNDFIAVSHSPNQALTWTTPMQVSLPAQNGTVQGAQLAVGPNGEVYVAYEVFYTGNNRQQFLAKSTDGGQTFTTPVAITPVFSDLTFSSTYRKNSLPAMAVNPTTGDVVVLYAAQLAQGAKIQFIISTNGGAGFSNPVTINDVPTGQQFMPAVAIDSAGVIHASWFDTRNNPGSAAQYDIYATFSRDRGASFAPNGRVTLSLINAGSATFIGDYSGNAAAGGFAHPVWTSGGFNNGRLQTATLTTP